MFDKQYIVEKDVKWGRMLIWKAAYEAFKTSPVIGIGTDVFYKESLKYINMVKADSTKKNEKDLSLVDNKGGVNPHSLYLTFLTENGIIGLSLLLLLILAALIYFKRNKRNVSLIILLGLLFVSSVSSYAPYYKYYLLILMLFYITAENNLKMNNGLR
jgi:O-antigen ligase